MKDQHQSEGKQDALQQLTETVERVPAEHTQELRALIMGFIAGVNSVMGKREAS